MMKGTTPTKAQKRFHDLLASNVGCIACFIDGGRQQRNTYCSIHHIDGRTKPWAHWWVLPLCADHHQHGTGYNVEAIAVHPFKRRFEKHYGTQIELLADCVIQLAGMGLLNKSEAMSIVEGSGCELF